MALEVNQYLNLATFDFSSARVESEEGHTKAFTKIFAKIFRIFVELVEPNGTIEVHSSNPINSPMFELISKKKSFLYHITLNNIVSDLEKFSETIYFTGNMKVNLKSNNGFNLFVSMDPMYFKIEK